MKVFRTQITLPFCFAHRLINHGGKCRNIHGHNSKAVIVFRGGDVDDSSRMLGDADMSALKATVQGWLDTNWDHALLLGVRDPLVDLLKNAHTYQDDFQLTHGSQTYVFNGEPTTETMAEHLYYKIVELLKDNDRVLEFGKSFYLESVTIHETEKNAARFDMME